MPPEEAIGRTVRGRLQYNIMDKSLSTAGIRIADNIPDADAENNKQ